MRLWAQNWDSPFVAAWIMQIIYSELLGVPSSMETGLPDKKINFYSETNRMDYGKRLCVSNLNSESFAFNTPVLIWSPIPGLANEYEMFQAAYDAPNGDCAVYAEDDGYIPCAHAVMEAWFPNGNYFEKQKAGVAEPFEFSGAVGVQTWMITKFTLEREPSLGTFFGMQGEANREKLTRVFKRPVNFMDYCAKYSPTNCTVKDDVTTRVPAADGSEDGRYFVDGVYTGHFRATEKNDCNKQTNCTGHFMDFPCGWSSFFTQVSHHLDIALESDGTQPSGGYTYSEMVDLWNAAAATKSNLIGMWWWPDATHSSLIGTDAELMKVSINFSSLRIPCTHSYFCSLHLSMLHMWSAIVTWK